MIAVVKKPACFKCGNEAIYTQPDKDTGEIVDVCEKHFILKYMG
jgi:hypothetical protein